MSIVSKIIGIVLAFVLLVFTPLICVTLPQTIRTERVTWNALTDYTDTVTDKGVITKSDYETFVAKLGSTMIDYKVSIVWRSKAVLPTTDSTGIVTGYTYRYVTKGVWGSEHGGVIDSQFLAKGDQIQIILEPLTRSTANQILSGVFNLNTANREYSYAGQVRNNGSNYVG